MSLSATTLVAPPRDVAPRDVAQGVPFAGPTADGVGGWVLGLLFGLLCILAAFVFVATIAVVALARAAWRGIASVADSRTGTARVGRPVLA